MSMEYGVDTDANRASFNDAQGQAIRLHALATRIIDSRFAPFSPNLQFGVLNFEVRIQSLNSLWQEVRVKCNADEIDLIKSIRNLIQSSEEVEPVLNVRERGNVGVSINLNSWKKLDKLLIIYEEELRKLQDKYGLGNPSRDSARGL